MLHPGARARWRGSEVTIERHVGGGDYIVSSPKGRFTVNARALVPVEAKAPPIPKIVTPEAPPPAPVVPKTMAELRAEARSKGIKIPRGSSREDIERMLTEEE